MKGVLYGNGVLWNDPPTICDSAYFKRTNRFRETINNLEGECIQYDVTYELVRNIYGTEKYRKRTSGRIWNATFWDFFNRNLLIENYDTIKEDDTQLEWL